MAKYCYIYGKNEETTNREKLFSMIKNVKMRRKVKMKKQRNERMKSEKVKNWKKAKSEKA